MKLYVGDIVTISSAAGWYKTKIVDVVRANAADGIEYDWFRTEHLQEYTDSGERLPKRGYFNENMADQIVKSIERNSEVD